MAQLPDFKGLGNRNRVLVVRELGQFRALSHPLRRKILERMAHEPRTTKQVAEELEERPTRLYHHVAALEQAGLIELVGTRKKRGTTEKYYLTVAERFEINPALFPGADQGEAVASGRTMVDQMLGELRGEMGALLERASPDDLATLAEEGLIANLEIQASPERIEGLRARIREFIAESSAADAGADSEHYRLFLSFFPLGDPPSENDPD